MEKEEDCGCDSLDNKEPVKPEEIDSIKNKMSRLNYHTIYFQNELIEKHFFSLVEIEYMISKMWIEEFDDVSYVVVMKTLSID